MTILVGSSIAATLLGFALALIISPNTIYAQGSAGGSIGNDDKAVSGSRPEPRSAAPQHSPRRSKSEDEPRRSPSRRSGGGGGGNADGAWVISSAGVTCPDTFTETVVVTSGRIVGAHGTGTVSPSGSVSGVGNYSGIIVRSQGRMVGRTGSGTFQRSDGCTGRWTSSKQ
ncbi:MAG TPA: hypothetical protein VGO01_22040 [Bradyrhizobium sp.]|jgi:hypothetical protein|nr:hypothetical protein [Bradyrhizobium sp.]